MKSIDGVQKLLMQQKYFYASLIGPPHWYPVEPINKVLETLMWFWSILT